MIRGLGLGARGWGLGARGLGPRVRGSGLGTRPARLAAWRGMLAFALACGAAVLGAHDASTARVAFVGGHPRSGQRVEVRVQLLGPGGAPVSLADDTIQLVADMTMHAMTPVEAMLSHEYRSDVRAADVAFTMPGEWRITVRIDGPTGPRAAVFPLTVLHGDAAGQETDLNVDVAVRALPRPTLFDPWAVVAVAVGLVVAAEATAIVFYRRRRAAQAAFDAAPARKTLALPE